MSSVPIVGKIYNPPGYDPAFTQPGGIGTPVFPAQTTGESVSYWIGPACGHFFNSAEIRSATVGGVQVAVVGCPLCRLVFRIISPYSAIYQEANWILFP